ncbi:flavonol synthase/flavanone 3-hydroxylase [Nymphaea colorata]|nr:flavonol synthase/flavanone 3-hydroxylase [Nymphaea colorata]
MAAKPVKRVEFRAPPPSPIAAFKIGLENEASLDEFLRRSVRVPELILPYHLFPTEEFGGDPPEIDFSALAASEDRSVAELLSSAEAKGCFQLVNHGVPKETVGAIREAITEFFNLPSEQKLVLSRNPASKSGYEEISGDGFPITEELLWCGDEKKIMSPAMSSVWPQGSHGYKNFRRQLKRLSKETEGIARKILQVLHERASRKRVPSEPLAAAEEEKGTVRPVFCFYKHHFESQDGQQLQGDHLHTDVLRLLVRRSDFSHTLCINFPCDSSEFRIYSKKGWTSFVPKKEAIIFTIGDQIQKRIKGQYKHVVGRGMLSIRKDRDHSGDQVSVALFYSPSPSLPPPLSLDSHASDHHEQPCERSITIVQQIKIVLYLILFYHILNFIKQFT